MRWLIALPFERPEHMGMDVAAELQALGHTVETFAYRRRNVLYKNRSTKSPYQRLIANRLVARARAWRPDVVLVVKGSALPAPALERVRAVSGAKLVNLFPDNPLWMIDLPAVAAYDVFFTKERYALRQLQLAGLRNVQYLAPWCIPAYHHPVELTDAERARLDGVAAFVGAWYPYREHVVAALAEPRVRIWGPGWARCLDPQVRALVAGGSVWGREKLAVYCGATVSLNVHHPINDIAGVNTRLFELAAAGACQLVDLKEDLSVLFKPGEEVVSFRDLGELRRKLAYYLAHPDEARAIGENARRRAHAEHTVRRRVEEVIAVLRERCEIGS